MGTCPLGSSSLSSCASRSDVAGPKQLTGTVLVSHYKMTHENRPRELLRKYVTYGDGESVSTSPSDCVKTPPCRPARREAMLQDL